MDKIKKLDNPTKSNVELTSVNDQYKMDKIKDH